MMAMQIATLDHITAIFLPSKYQGNGIDFAFYNMIINRTFIATPRATVEIMQSRSNRGVLLLSLPISF